MKIVCVYKSGGDFNEQYVKALKTSLSKFCPVPFDFYCLTDLSYEVEKYSITIDLKHNWPGWWSKLELFNPSLPFNKSNETVLYFDLDVLILRDISNLVELTRYLVHPMMLRCSDPVGAENDWPSSSIMAWKGDLMSGAYYAAIQKGITEVIQKTYQNSSRAGQRTDQGFIRTIIDPNKFQDFLPDGYIAFKYPDYVRNPKVIETATILNWTGKPRFPEMGESLTQIKMLWKEHVSDHKINQVL